MNAPLSRRQIFRNAAGSAAAACASAAVIDPAAFAIAADAPGESERGAQRLSPAQLRKWESLGYGMFIHFGMSTFVQNELPEGKAPATVYNPDRLDVDQWISVARDAGMKYAVLTTKHVAGHCLWPSAHTAYTVAASGSKTDVVEAFVKACEKRGILPGFYYCSWDNHNRFGSRTPSDAGAKWGWDRHNFRAPATQPVDAERDLPAYTTSIYQCFQSAQLKELLTGYGPIAEVWIDIPGVLGWSYRNHHYVEIAALQPQTVIMMNTGISDGTVMPVDYAWPSDLIAIERRMPPATGHLKWREIEGKRYYVPGEICDPIGKHWFWVEGDKPRPDKELADQLIAARKAGVNMLLDVPPDRHGLIPDGTVQALMRLRKNANV